MQWMSVRFGIVQISAGKIRRNLQSEGRVYQSLFFARPRAAATRPKVDRVVGAIRAREAT
jgi:hypothetical protein